MYTTVYKPRLVDNRVKGRKDYGELLKALRKRWNQLIFFMSYVCGPVIVVIMNMCTLICSSWSILKTLST